MFPPPLPENRGPSQPSVDVAVTHERKRQRKYLAVAVLPLGLIAIVAVRNAYDEFRHPGSVLGRHAKEASASVAPAAPTPSPAPAPAARPAARPQAQVQTQTQAQAPAQPQRKQATPADSFSNAIPAPPDDPQPQLSQAEQARNQQMAGEVTRIGRKIFGDSFLDVQAADTAEGWKLDVKIFDPASDPAALQRKIKQLSVGCHPRGMKVRRLSFDISSEFTTTNNRTVTERLMLLMLDPSKTNSLDWDNPASFRFHDAFKTIAVSDLYREHWIKANES